MKVVFAVPGFEPAGSMTVATFVMASNIQVAVCAPPGLSVKVPVKFTGVFTSKIAPLAGPVIVTTGAGLVTVTVCWQKAVLFEASLAVQVMVVVPAG